MVLPFPWPRAALHITQPAHLPLILLSTMAKVARVVIDTGLRRPDQA